MSKSNACETGILSLIFLNADFAGIGDAGGLLQSAADGNLYVSLHTSDPGEAGVQTTNEAAYTSYARVAVARDGSAWVVTGGSVSPAADVVFPTGTGGSGTATHFGVGTASSGAGILLYSGTLTPNIAMGSGVTPKVLAATAITED